MSFFKIAFRNSIFAMSATEVTIDYSVLLPPHWRRSLDAWLAEDIPAFDAAAAIVGRAPARAQLLAKASGFAKPAFVPTVQLTHRKRALLGAVCWPAGRLSTRSSRRSAAPWRGRPRCGGYGAFDCICVYCCDRLTFAIAWLAFAPASDESAACDALAKMAGGRRSRSGQRQSAVCGRGHRSVLPTAARRATGAQSAGARVGHGEQGASPARAGAAAAVARTRGRHAQDYARVCVAESRVRAGAERRMAASGWSKSTRCWSAAATCTAWTSRR